MEAWMGIVVLYTTVMGRFWGSGHQNGLAMNHGDSVSPGLRRLRDCEVLPWDNRIRQRAPVLLRFTSTMAMDVLGGGGLGGPF